ncbi:MAG: hypothetical protein QOE01_3470 [Actinomycetota bacterium]|jgi:hypothetical protein|nr:hypothetical protein [Actinomycetota bacterium]
MDQRKTGGGIRLGVLVLAASAAFPGVWALFWPHSFFADFPGLGQHWVAQIPPYNEHLVRDVGSFYVGFAALMGIAALTGDKRVIRISLFTWLVFSIPHLVWHSQNMTGSGGIARWGSVVALGSGVVLALLLLLVVRRR